MANRLEALPQPLELIREPARRPRILFLADRNILVNQAYNAFSAFPEDAMVRIEPEDIRKKGRVPKLRLLIELKYHSISDARLELGAPEEIRAFFAGFQKYLFQPAAPPR